MHWQPIIETSERKDHILATLARIASDLKALNEKDSADVGLLYGVEGLIIFFLYYGRFAEQEIYQHHGKAMMQKIFTAPDHEDVSFANGYAGLGWLAEHLYQNGFVKDNPDQSLKAMDKSIYQPMLNMVKKGSYSLKTGALGIGLYYLSRKESVLAKRYLENLIKALSQAAQREQGGAMKWTMIKNDHSNHEVDLGVLRGMAGIVSFLTRVCREKILLDDTLQLLEGATKYILKNQFLNPAKGYFPYAVSEEKTLSDNPSRLAWCYGDLGIAYALRNAADVLDDDEMRADATRILNFSANRKGIEENKVWDACLCHGTSGVGHIFQRLYQKEQSDLFKETSLYWIDQTLAMHRRSDLDYGYKNYNPRSKNYTNDISLLHGTAGIGLALMAAVDDHVPLWDNCLLL